MKGVTILICTYNGAKRLFETLRCIAAQQIPGGLNWEVLVVSNASIDDTLAIAPRLWAELGAPAPLRLLDEPRPGKENALVRGFDEAGYEYICIVDDDNWLYDDYVARVVSVMQERPQIGILGACAEGAFEIEPPTWFKQFQAYYAVGPQAAQSGPLHQLEAYIYGAGSVVRRSGWRYLRDNGFVFTTSTKRGKVIVSGEDVELGNALRLAGYELWYDAGLRLRHFMYKERLTWAYLRRIAQGAVASALTGLVYYQLYREPGLNLAAFRMHYLRGLAWLGRDIMRRPAALLSYIRHRHDEQHRRTFGALHGLSKLKLMLGGRRDAERIFLQVKKMQANFRENPVPIRRL